jgi:hypothetical protein
MNLVEPASADVQLHQGLKRLSVVAFLVIVVVYVGILQGLTLFLTRDLDVEYAAPTTTEQLWRSISVPVAVALVFVVAVVAVLGWARPVMIDRRPVQRWLIVVPIFMVAIILLGTNYSGLADKGAGFTVLMLLSALAVGFGEEAMFRGIGVTVFRTNGFTEGRVALWSTVIFGVAHASNIFAEGPKAGLQVAVTIVAGYFFYLIRRRTGGLLACALIHGLWDFGLISGAIVEDETYPGAAAFVMANIVLAVILFVRRHKIEPAPAPAV